MLAAATAVVAPYWTLGDETGQQIAPLLSNTNALMSEDYRASVTKIVVLPGATLAGAGVTGSYQRETLGLLDGIDHGRGVGSIVKDIYGIPIGLSIPILSLPGAIVGGVSGASKRAVQDFRDALTKDLSDSADVQLSDDALATDVFWRLRDVETLDPKIFATTTPIPDDTDALLYVSYSGSTIDVQEDEAVLTMSATASLTRRSDGMYLYERQVHYQDRDKLQNWTENNSAAWHDFAAYARHYLGREIAAQLYERVDVQSELRPRKTATVVPDKKDEWHAVSKTTTPTFAWDLNLESDESQALWVGELAAVDIAYEFEIYDQHQIIYGAKDIREPQFKLDLELEACKTYRWTVRPSFRIDGELRFGEWMRWDEDSANGNDGKAAATASAYIYDFASLEIKCGSERA